jgi:hypothetical protein
METVVNYRSSFSPLLCVPDLRDIKRLVIRRSETLSLAEGFLKSPLSVSTVIPLGHASSPELLQ